MIFYWSSYFFTGLFSFWAIKIREKPWTGSQPLTGPPGKLIRGLKCSRKKKKKKMRKRRQKPPLGPEDGAGPHLSTRRKWCFTSAVPLSSGIRSRGWAGPSGSGHSLIRSRPGSTGMWIHRPAKRIRQKPDGAEMHRRIQKREGCPSRFLWPEIRNSDHGIKIFGSTVI